MKRSTVLFNALLAVAALAAPQATAMAAPAVATAGAGGSYPANTTFAGVSINGLQSGFGAELDLDGTGVGQFCAILLGLSPLGVEQNVRLEGEVTGGSQLAPNVAVLSGTATVDLGDGLPPAEGVPFTATITTDANGLGTIGLVTALASLPNATMNVGSMTIN